MDRIWMEKKMAFFQFVWTKWMDKYLTYDDRHKTKNGKRKREDKIRKRAYLDQFCDNERRMEMLCYEKREREKKKIVFLFVSTIHPNT